MFRLLCLTVALLHVAAGFDITRSKGEHVQFTEQDIVPKGQTRLIGNERASQFIGDFQIGQRLGDEYLYTRSLEIENRSGVVYSTTLNVELNRGVIHYVSVLNTPGSTVVICSDPNILGSSTARLRIRVPASSISNIQITVASH